MLRPYKTSRVVAMALNTSALAEADARRALDAAARETGLPAGDVVRFGAGPVLGALRRALDLERSSP
jgi:uncharacterized NAD-dependent epimerase/dehydratase family protein